MQIIRIVTHPPIISILLAIGKAVKQQVTENTDMFIVCIYHIVRSIAHNTSLPSKGRIVAAPLDAVCLLHAVVRSRCTPGYYKFHSPANFE